MSNEDARAAATIITSLSSYVITASLAVLGAQAVITTFVLDKRTDLAMFYVVASLGAACLVASILVGGRGINEVATRGKRGSWETRTRHHAFDWQAWLTLIGLAFVAASLFFGTSKADATQQRGDNRVAVLQGQISSLQRRVARLETRVAASGG